jgi:hypothetical protein
MPTPGNCGTCKLLTCFNVTNDDAEERRPPEEVQNPSRMNFGFINDAVAIFEHIFFGVCGSHYIMIRQLR